MTDSVPAWEVDARRRLADELRAAGAIRSRIVYDAFRAVSRHVFLPEVYRRRNGEVVRDRLADGEGDPALVYRDRTFVTLLDDDGAPASSSTAPSTMAFLLEALDLRPGLRVLEIGCGTGYNAALMHAAGCAVVTVDPLSAEVAKAREALRRHGFPQVRCLAADGYSAVPGGAPYDRVIVSCAIAGVPPGWLAVIAEHARLVAPVLHGGIDMLLRVDAGAGEARVRPIGGAGYFIHADGRLCPVPPGPPGAGRYGAASVRVPSPAVGYRDGYHDMWFAAAVADERVTSVRLPGNDGDLGDCGLVEGDSAAVIRVDGTVLGTGPAARRLALAGAGLVERWADEGRPKARTWRAGLVRHPSAEPALLVPDQWRRD
jgi:protein-L-isoaspartate(D-aspartate) O-methyltransferase